MAAAPNTLSVEENAQRSGPNQPTSVQLGHVQSDKAQAGNGAHANALGLQLLMQIERDARRAKTVTELQFLMANETRRSIGARQIFVFHIVNGQPETVTVSSLSAVERHTPVISWIEGRAKALLARAEGLVPLHGNLTASPAAQTGAKDIVQDPARIFPFAESLIARINTPDGRPLGAIMAVRETVFGDAEAMVLQRLCETCGHAWAALGGAKPSLIVRLKRPLPWLVLAGALCLAGLLPVPLTALAPAEVVALEPAIIAAPIDGAIEQILVEPNQMVTAGDVLFRYADAQAKGTLDVATREVAVAEAKLRQASQLAFVDPAAKRELAVARSELKLKRAEQVYASDLFERTIMRAPRSGVAVFADKRELVGRPVSIGQRVMELADPTRTQFRVHVPVDDAVVLKDGAHVRIFMDADPLNPLVAHITRAAPMVRQSESGSLVFRAEAALDPSGIMPPLGHRGTAQISGEKVALAFYLFRRPIAVLRQRTGL
jgi:HlyD family secretion protein/Biotin-lipoyl like